jgi:hypothetical protein
MKPRLLTAALAWLLAADIGVASAAAVRVRVVDDATGQAVAARAYLWRGDASLLPVGFSTYDRDDERHFLVAGDFMLDLQPGTYRLRIERGTEYVPVDVDVAVPRADTLAIRLRRWVDMNRAGWYSADMHVHRDPADVPLILRAEDLNFVPTITTHVWSTAVNEPWKSLPEFLTIVEPGRFFTSNSQEIERIQGGPGAVILLGRNVPLPFTGGELYPPSATWARAVHAQGGFVEGDKPFWVDVFVNALLGHIDALEVNCNHFLPRVVDTDLARWSHWPLEFGYRGERGFAEWMMDSYYRILNAGAEVPLSAGTANGVKAGPVGFNRVYVRGENASIDYDGFMAALKQGRSFSTNGPMLELEIDGAPAPGLRIVLEPGRDYRVRARARWWGELERLQLVVNGVVAADEAGPNTGELVLEKPLRCDRSSWVAVRAFARVPPHEAWQPTPVIFAHTSPAYLLKNGAPVLVRTSLTDLLARTDALIAHTERLGGFEQASDRKETLDLYRRARELLERRLEQARNAR